MELQFTNMNFCISMDIILKLNIIDLEVFVFWDIIQQNVLRLDNKWINFLLQQGLQF